MVAQSVQSSAADANTVEWQTTFLLTRLINRIDMMMEISDTQAVASLLGYGPELVSDSFTYIGALEHANYIFNVEKHKVDIQREHINDRKAMDGEETGSEMEDFIEDDCSHEHISDHDESMEDFVVPPDIGSNADYGPTTLYKVDDTMTFPVPVYYPELYRSRGRELAFLNRCEYFALINIDKLPSDKSGVGAGRKRNSWFKFSQSSPMEAKCAQFIRS